MRSHSRIVIASTCVLVLVVLLYAYVAIPLGVAQDLAEAYGRLVPIWPGVALTLLWLGFATLITIVISSIVASGPKRASRTAAYTVLSVSVILLLSYFLVVVFMLISVEVAPVIDPVPLVRGLDRVYFAGLAVAPVVSMIAIIVLTVGRRSSPGQGVVDAPVSEQGQARRGIQSRR